MLHTTIQCLLAILAGQDHWFKFFQSNVVYSHQNNQQTNFPKQKCASIIPFAETNVCNFAIYIAIVLIRLHLYASHESDCVTLFIVARTVQDLSKFHAWSNFMDVLDSLQSHLSKIVDIPISNGPLSTKCAEFRRKSISFSPRTSQQLLCHQQNSYGCTWTTKSVYLLGFTRVVLYTGRGASNSSVNSYWIFPIKSGPHVLAWYFSHESPHLYLWGGFRRQTYIAFL